MGLKSFLKDQGFIQESPDSSSNKSSDKSKKPSSAQTVAPEYFPITPASEGGNSTSASGEPSFVAPLSQTISKQDQPDPAFIKFFEDELAKANLPGPDYFEFRQSLLKTQQKMAAKGVVAPEVVLQAVLTSFEAQDITRSKLVTDARHYKEVIQQKKEDFVNGAEAEKNKQLQKRENVLKTHSDNISRMQSQLQQLEVQRKQLEDSLNKEKTQMDVDKSLGKEGIEKIERAQRLINTAYAYMQSVIDDDIKNLQSL